MLASQPVQQAVILAAGMGTRLPSALRARPKCLAPLGTTTPLERTCSLLQHFGIRRITIVAGYEGRQIEDLICRKSLPVHLAWNHDFAATGSMESLACAALSPEAEWLLIESDLVFEVRAIQELLFRAGPDSVLASGPTGHGDEVYLLAGEDGRLSRMTKNPSHASQSAGELVGITRWSAAVYHELCGLYRNLAKGNRTCHYEDMLNELCRLRPVEIHRVDSLLWTEFDTAAHWKRLEETIYPQILAQET